MLVESEDEPTIEKTRFLDSLTGNKVFETYQIGESVASKADSEELLTNLRSVIGDFDLVLVADYGHGLLDSGVISELSSHARLLSVNTQSNAGNRGFNTISKYPRLDVVILNGAEVALELREKHLRMEVLVPELLERTQAKFVGVTMGAKGLIYGVKGETGIAVETVPAFSTVVKDRVGAGDALFAVTSVALAAEASPLVASLLGNLAGAASIAELGNRVTIDRTSLLRHASATLK
jgi:bifunctional ADP-heptose synthase (sugar kinase/adenylyltransferase)